MVKQSSIRTLQYIVWFIEIYIEVQKSNLQNYRPTSRSLSLFQRRFHIGENTQRFQMGENTQVSLFFVVSSWGFKSKPSSIEFVQSFDTQGENWSKSLVKTSVNHSLLYCHLLRTYWRLYCCIAIFAIRCLVSYFCCFQIRRLLAKNKERNR